MSEREGVSRRDVLRISAVAGIGAAFGGGLVTELVRLGKLHRVEGTRARLGTLVSLRIVHPDPVEGRRWVESAFGEIDRLEAILSRHRPDTPVAVLNRDGVLAGPPPELVEVLDYAQALSRTTGGAFDVTIAPLLGAYTRAAAGGGLPARPDIEKALTRVDHRRLVVDSDRVAFERPGMSVTLDGIAKGFVVDRTVAHLVTVGADRVLVDAGGDIAVGGAGSQREPWRVGVERAPAVGTPGRAGRSATLQLSGGAIATSGDYLQAFTEDRSAHHVLDPRSGRSPDFVSVTSVTAPTAMEADALSTAGMILGPERAIELWNGLAGVEGLVVDKAGSRSSTPGFGRI